MNKILYCLIIVALSVSCTKETNLLEDNRCSSLVIDNPATQLLSDQKLDTIKYLFNKNHLRTTSLQFFNYQESRGYQNILFKYIVAYQFVNGLKVFTDYRGFEFGKNDSLVFMDGDTILSLNLPKKPRLSLFQVRAIFSNAINTDGYKLYSSMQDSCMNMEFGYYDLNAGTGNIIHKYTTAWKINPKNREYPYAFIDDLNVRLIYYDNGIRTLWENKATQR